MELNQSAIEQLNKQLTVAYHATVLELNQAAIKQIESPTWKWPRYTKRKNGNIAGLTRDIKDTGKLLKAQGIRVNSPDRIDLVNTADHAAAVALGSKRGRTISPGRNWMRAAVRSGDNAARFKRNFEEARS
jgi:hypothetical protein